MTVTVRVHLILPPLTPGARHGIVGTDDHLDERSQEVVRRRAQPWPDGLDATCAPEFACAETAELVGLHATVDPRVRDWDLGAWTGRSLTDIATQAPQDLAHWSNDPEFDGHGGESLRQLRSRATSWLDELETEDHLGLVNLVTVAPTAVVRAVLVNVLNAPDTTFWRVDLEPLASVHVSLRPGRRAVRWPAT